MFILFAFRHCHAAVFSDSPRCYYLHLANVLHAGALPERLMAGLSDMREAQPIYTDYHTLRDFVTAFPLSLLLNAKWSSPHKFFRRFCFIFCFQFWFLEAWIGFEVWVFSVHAWLC
jgi:hypothetical protein